jgi:hypothetical protein
MKWFYKNREERGKWLAQRFSKELETTKSLLDIGCDNADLKRFISQKINYKGIDIAGKPDIYINLDEIEKLPFENNFFDMVVCTDVLEHLEQLHLVFDEMCRVSSNYLLITLPNAYASIPEFLIGKKYTKDVEKLKKFGKYSKFYGLPLDRPSDRHRWFFSFDEAVDFVKYRAGKFGFKLIIAESEYKYLKKQFLRKLFFSILRKLNKNLVDRNIILLLKKQ